MSSNTFTSARLFTGMLNKPDMLYNEKIKEDQT